MEKAAPWAWSGMDNGDECKWTSDEVSRKCNLLSKVFEVWQTL